MGICILCKEQKDLINAHIIPKWAFKYLYPDNPQKKQRPLSLLKKGEHIRRPIGPYDQNLLCKECDNFLGIYDDYGKRVLLETDFIKKTELSLIAKNVDFSKLQLFLLAVIWRASISNREEFERVSIGLHEDKIREILSEVKKGGKKDFLENYSFIVTKFHTGDLPHDVVNKNIQIPHTQRIGGVNVVILFMPRGLKIIIKIDKRPFVCELEKIANYHQDGLLIVLMGNYADSPEFNAMLRAIG